MRRRQDLPRINTVLNTMHIALNIESSFLMVLLTALSAANLLTHSLTNYLAKQVPKGLILLGTFDLGT